VIVARARAEHKCIRYKAEDQVSCSMNANIEQGPRWAVIGRPSHSRSNMAGQGKNSMAVVGVAQKAKGNISATDEVLCLFRSVRATSQSPESKEQRQAAWVVVGGRWLSL